MVSKHRATQLAGEGKKLLSACGGGCVEKEKPCAMTRRVRPSDHDSKKGQLALLNSWEGSKIEGASSMNQNQGKGGKITGYESFENCNSFRKKDADARKGRMREGGGAARGEVKIFKVLSFRGGKKQGKKNFVPIRDSDNLSSLRPVLCSTKRKSADIGMKNEGGRERRGGNILLLQKIKGGRIS